MKIFWAACVAATLTATAAFGQVDEKVGISVKDAIIDEMIAKQQARNAGSGWFYVTVESNNIAGGGGISVFEKINNKFGYFHVPPDGVAAMGILSADAAGMAAIDADSTFGWLDVFTGGWATDEGVYDELFEAAKRYGAKEKDVKAAFDAMLKFREKAKFVEKTEMGGRESFFLYADGLNYTQIAEGVTYTIKKMGLWIDVNDYVITGMSFAGDSKQGKKTDSFEIEQVLSDYQTVMGASILIPHKKAMSVRLGHIDNEETERMKKALKEAEWELAGIKAKVANGDIPAAQGNMIANQIAAAIEQQKKFLESMATGGIGAEVEVIRTWSTPTKEGLKQALKEAAELSAKQAGANAAQDVLNKAQ